MSVSVMSTYAKFEYRCVRDGTDDQVLDLVAPKTKVMSAGLAESSNRDFVIRVQKKACGSNNKWENTSNIFRRGQHFSENWHI